MPDQPATAACTASWGQQYIDHYTGDDGKCRRCGAVTSTAAQPTQNRPLVRYDGERVLLSDPLTGQVLFQLTIERTKDLAEALHWTIKRVIDGA